MEEFYGSKLTARECEILALTVDKSHRQNEADLVMSRWFDYSSLHPIHTTYLYAHLYKVQTRIFNETYVDTRTAAEARAFAPNDIFESRDMTGMWLARRFADRLGIPYDFVLRFAQERCFARLWSRFPRPNQLYSEEMEVDLVAAWEEGLTRSMRYSRESRFKASQHVKVGHQKRHVRFVIDQIKGRQKPHVNLLARMFHEDVLNPALVADHFEERDIKQAQEVAFSLAHQS